MAYNNFTPIQQGALATAQSINSPMGQLSDAIDGNAADIDALETATAAKVGMPIFCRCSTVASNTSKLCVMDLDAYGAKDTVKAGDLFLIVFQVGSTLAPTAIRIQYDGTTIKNATPQGIPQNIAAGSAVLLYYDGTYFRFVGYTYDAAYPA